MYLLYCLTLLLILILICIYYGDDNGAGVRKQKENFNSFSGLTNNSDTPWTIDTPTKNIVITIAVYEHKEW